MLTHHALKRLKRRTGLTKSRWVKLIGIWHYNTSSGHPGPNGVRTRDPLACRALEELSSQFA